jgi:hypothetical protein
MTRSEPHPQRCETCEHREIVHNYGLNTDRPRCKITKWFLDACSPTTIEHDFIDVVGCATHSSQPVPDSTTLMQMAKTEWHNREERFGLHDAISWTTGWMAGYLTTNKPNWSKEHDTTIRKAERERVLDAMREEILLCRYNISYPEIQDESADHLLKKIESLRGGEQR